MDNFSTIIMAGLVATTVNFILGGALYMNPFVAKIYKSFKGKSGLKIWKDQKKYMASVFFFGCLLPSLVFAFVYNFIAPVFDGSNFENIMIFALIMIFVRFIPRFIDMWIQSTYPNKLMYIE